LGLVASGENSVWIVDANDLASFQGYLAIIVQGLDHAAVGLQRELGNLNLTGDSDSIDIVADDLGALEQWTLRSALVPGGLTTTSLPVNRPAAMVFMPTHAAGNWNCRFFGTITLTPLTEILPPVLYSEESATALSRAPSKMNGMTAAFSKAGKIATKEKNCLIIAEERLQCLILGRDIVEWMEVRRQLTNEAH
jgi:hypothetical protein